MIPCDREGSFRATITAFGLKQMESGAISVAIKATLTELFSDGVWHPWAEYEMEAEGDQWIVKRDGNLNQGAAEALIRHAGWDGNMESIVGETWQPTPCQVTVKREEYEGKARFKIAFVNAFDRTPGGLSNIDAAKAKELQARFGGQLRAIGGNTKRQGAPVPNGKPAVPAPATPRPAPPAPPGYPQVESEEIPF